jgi:hypothetical protein
MKRRIVELERELEEGTLAFPNRHAVQCAGFRSVCGHGDSAVCAAPTSAESEGGEHEAD